MAKLDDLKQEAKELGLTFSPNISESKLQDRVNEFYEAQDKAAAEKLAGEVKAKEAEKAADPVQSKVAAEEDVKSKMRKLAVEMEKDARKTHIIVITDNDQRENNLTTTVSLTCGNGYFELGTKRIPLNEPVEVEQGFINVAKEVKIPMHVKNHTTGKTQTVIRNRYSISYEDELKKDDEE